MSTIAPSDAIDPGAAYEQWVGEYRWQVDQLPNVVEATGTVAMAPRRLRAQQLHERVSDGGFIDNVPVVDGPETRNAVAVWNALRAYLTVASSRLGIEGPQLPSSLPDDVELARQWAYAANEWLAERVHHILDWPDLSELQETLFRLICRAATRLNTSIVRRVRPDLCALCGEAGVVIDWVDGVAGQPTLTRTCTVCGAMGAASNG